MGTAFSGRIAPVAPPISVLPAPVPPTAPTNESSLESSLRSKQNNSSSGDKASSNQGGTRSRPGSRVSRRSSSGNSAGGVGGGGRQGSAFRKGLNSASKVHSRPASHTRVPPFSGFPFQRESVDLGVSLNRTLRSAQLAAGNVASDVVELQRAGVSDAAAKREIPVTCCQLCGNGFTAIGIRAPMLLLCGHTYCNSCLETARDAGAEALKCGVCGVLTCTDQQLELPKNEAMLDLISSKEYQQLTSEQGAEKCAECESSVAALYCTECAAAYCQACAKRAHEGSKVRSRHKRVAIAQKPCPQPTCKKHPGQSCVLYCETEKLPMCVLCKFYGQHRFHKYEILGKTANQYCAGLTEKLDKIEKMANELDAAAKGLWEAERQVNSSALKTQEILEKHFDEMRKTYLTALEKREASLLMMVDKQVSIKQDILLEFRMEIAASRARVLTAKEEATKLLRLNPVAALLSRKHVDTSLDVALKQSVTTPPTRGQPEVPMILYPDITKAMTDDLERHGGILQLPPTPSFTEVKVATHTISLQWEAPDQNGGNITSDRTVTFSLHCFANQYHDPKHRAVLRQMPKPVHTTPESGFEDMAENPPLSTGELVKYPPLLLPALVTDRRMQLVADPNAFPKMVGVTPGKVLSPPSHQGSERDPGLPPNKNNLGRFPPLKAGQSSMSETDDSASNDPKNLKCLPTEAADMAIAKGGALSGPPGGGPKQQKPTQLNLPPLIVSKPQPNAAKGRSHTEGTSSPAYSWSDTIFESAASDLSEVTPVPLTPSQGTAGDEGSTPDPSRDDKTESTSSVESESSMHDSGYTDLGRYCKGYAYEEIYSGDKMSFHYSGLVPGAIYYFRVRSHNAAGWGPWSDTIKCTTRKWKSHK